MEPELRAWRRPNLSVHGEFEIAATKFKIGGEKTKRSENAKPIR
jgi:hypothetical protein